MFLHMTTPERKKARSVGLGRLYLKAHACWGRVADLGTELVLAGNPIVIPAHLGSGAVAQEEGCLITEIHLRVLVAAITLIFELAERDIASNIHVSAQWFVEERCIVAA